MKAFYSWIVDDYLTAGLADWGNDLLAIPHDDTVASIPKVNLPIGSEQFRPSGTKGSRGHAKREPNVRVQTIRHVCGDDYRCLI